MTPPSSVSWPPGLSTTSSPGANTTEIQEDSPNAFHFGSEENAFHSPEQPSEHRATDLTEMSVTEALLAIPGC